MKQLLVWLLSFALITPSYAEFGRILHPFSAEPIDVVIPCAPKDEKTLSRCIEAIRRYGKNIRRVIVISKTRLTNDAEWFDENRYPFSKQDVAMAIFRDNERFAKKFLASKKTRIGWIYQQFLKLYAPFVIPEISSNVLVLDSDVIFLAPIEFMDDHGKPILHAASEYHAPYFDHMKRLLPELHRVHAQYSGVAHHMLFQRPVLEDLFSLIFERHHEEAWKAMCHCIDQSAIYYSSMSEYEIYFNFALLRMVDPRLVAMKFADVYPLREIQKYQDQGYAFITSHEYQN